VLVVDGHCHAGRGDALTAPWNSPAPLHRYLSRARAAGIGLTVVVPVFHHDSRRANAEVARVVARHPGRLVGFGWVHARRDAGRVGQVVAEAVDRYGLRGIKAHRLEAPIGREVCEAARRWRLPVLYDVAGQPHALDLMAPAYPDVTFIVPHLGSFADDWRTHRVVAEQLARHPNLYADTSGVRRFDDLVRAVRRAGPGKLVFGSDGPWLHPGVELHKVDLLGLGPVAARDVRGGTMLRLLGPSPARGADGRRRASVGVAP
jgi:predicted TIM-barrel fold metal-dependent hydrolase